jgi:FAD binding domain
MWIPGSPLGGSGPVSAAREYLGQELSAAAWNSQSKKIDAYLDDGPAMVAYFSALEKTPFRFDLDAATPDFHVKDGAPVGGRMVRARAFDARKLGRDLDKLRRPLPEFTLLGMPIESGPELNHFLSVARSLRSLAYVAWRLLGYLWDLLTHGRSMRLVNGNALVANLLAAAIEIERRAGEEARAKEKSEPEPITRTADTETPADAKLKGERFERIRLFCGHSVKRLIVEGDQVRGAWVSTPAGEREVRASRGVVLASGGFPHDAARIRELFPHAPTGCEHGSAAPAANTGDGLRMGEGAGGRVRPTLAAPAAWAPVSRLRRRDGSVAAYPHFIDRAKPGVIAVDRYGKRFCDEAGSYHDFVAKWIDASPSDGPLDAWLICDRCFLWTYGLGTVKPNIPFPWWSLLSGYLKVGRTIESLARKCGIDSHELRKTLTAYNEQAKPPTADPEFQRGESPYDKSQGDPMVRPNPCLAPILHKPFFAVRLQPGSLGTLAGLDTDDMGRVLSGATDPQPIPGLYACGNDMAAVMGGFYPANGITLGSAMTFGYRVGLSLRDKPKSKADAT